MRISDWSSDVCSSDLLFAKIQTRKTTHILSDTDDTRADLEWFMQRYPLNVRDTEREILAEGAARVQHRYQERMEILSLDWSPIDIPNVFREPHEPYLYQEQDAVLTVRQKALLLCDEIGSAAGRERGCPYV